MSRCFTWFPNWLVQENPTFTTIWCILQGSGDFTQREFSKFDDCPTCVVEKVWE